MPEIDEVVLKDYVATANNPEYNGDWSVINSKFPELEGVDEQLLKDYVATANNSKYNMDWEVINSKFPELKEERLEPGQGVLTPEAFEQGKQIPVAEKTAPAAGEKVVVTDSESVDGGLEFPFLRGRSGLPIMSQSEADKLKKDYPKEKKKQENKKLLESLEYIPVPGKDYEVQFDAPSQNILGGVPSGVDYLDSQYDKIVKGDYRGHYENGEFVLTPDFTLEDWFETDEGKAWWEKNWNAPRNNYVMKKADVYEHGGARPDASALEQIDYGIGRGLNYLGLGFNNETPEEQVFKAVNEDGAKEDQQFMPFINAGIQRGSEVNNIEALNIEIGN